MKWVHVQLGKDRVDCPASYIEGYLEGVTELKVKTKVWVFWSPVEDDTPKKVLAKQRKLIRVTSNVLRKNSGELIAGYYEGIILLVEDSEAALTAALDKKRVSIPTSKISPKPNKERKSSGKDKKSGSPNEDIKGADLKRKKGTAKKLTVDNFDNKVSPSSQIDSTAAGTAESSGPPSKKVKTDQKSIKPLPQKAEATPTGFTDTPRGKKGKAECCEGTPASPHDLEEDETSMVTTPIENLVYSPIKDDTSLVQEPMNSSLSDAESKLKEHFTDSSDSDSSDFPSGDDKSDSDVPKYVHTEVVNSLKEEKAAKREVKKKMKNKLALLQQQLEQAETKLRLEREEKTKLEGEMLRQHIRSMSTKVPKENDVVEESTKEPTSSQIVDSSKAIKGTTLDSKSGGSSSSLTADKCMHEQESSGEKKKALSNELLAKREALLKRTPKQKKSSNSVRRSLFTKDDWKDKEWIFTTAQQKALHKSVKKGASHDGRFVKKAIDLMWDRDDLYQRSAKGLPSFNSKEEARPECTPLKKAYLSSLLIQRALLEGDSKEDAAKRGDLEKLEAVLSSKISTVRRDMKKQPSCAPEDETDNANVKDNTLIDDLNFDIGLGEENDLSEN